MSFVIATGIGHCGSAWLAHILNRPDEGVRFHHQEKQYVFQGSSSWSILFKWEEEFGLSYPPAGAKGLPIYWDIMYKDLEEYPFVGDANSWTMTRLPEVSEHIKIDRVIYQLRNGIQQLHSLVIWNDNWPLYLKDWWADTFLQRHWQILGEPFGPWEDLTYWSKWCFWWYASVELTRWLRNYFPVEVYKLEDLVQNVDILGDVFKSFNLKVTEQELQELQETDLNRKIETDRRVSTIWSNWTPQQRVAFKRICGDTMERLGYEVPE